MRIRLALLLLLGAAPVAHANDFPTRARVEFVLAWLLKPFRVVSAFSEVAVWFTSTVPAPT